MGFKDQLRQLRREAEGEAIVIPQRDGTVRRFPSSASEDAFLSLMDRLGAGGDAPPEHPLVEAVRNSSDPRWLKTFYAVEDPDEWVKPIKDLSQ